MLLARRVKSLEKRAADGADRSDCGGKSWPAVLIANAPSGSTPTGWRVGCRSCGRIMHPTWISVGKNATAQQVRAFMEAI